MDFFSSVAQAFRQDGIWMWCIFATQVASIVIIYDRIKVLFFKRRLGEKNFAFEFEEDIKKGRLQEVLERTKRTNQQHPLSSIVEAGTQAALNMGGRLEIQAKMDEVLTHENAQLERRTGFLAMIGNVATLLGLLGTIVGMIQAFRSVSSEDAVTKAALLSQGISTAMHATAYGLVVAIPALVLFSILQNRAQLLSEDLTQGTTKVFNWLSFNYESIPSARLKVSEPVRESTWSR